jgi:thiamine-phosphate diphosphorylase
MNSKIFCHGCGGRLTEKYVEDRERLFCPACGEPVYENPVPSTAAVVIDEKGQLLLVKRKVEPKIGQWCLPGGFLELDETPEDGCLRELEEETGLSGEIDRWVGNISSKNALYKTVVVMGYTVKNMSGRLQARDDCLDARFFSLETMPPIAFASHRTIVENALKQEHVRNKRPHTAQTGDWGAYVITSGNHIEIAENACKAGAKILQYRDKTSSRKVMLEQAKTIRAITREHGTLFIVNDYIDIAMLCAADGVHLGQDDIPIAAARTITPGHFIIGRSTHSLEQALEAVRQGADYIGSGPVFATPTKENYIPIGIQTLEEVLKRVDIPVVAIGGLNPGNISELRQYGARNFAMVRAFLQNTGAVVRQINAIASGNLNPPPDFCISP